MTYKELYDKALLDLENDKITLGEFEKMIEPLNKEIPEESEENNNAITVNKTKLAKFIKEHLQGDCECRTLCYDYCGEYDCTESIEECIMNNLNNIQ